MKFKYSLLACSLLSMAACTPVEDIYDEIDAEGLEIVKSCDEYVLTEADYKSISKVAEKNAGDDDKKKDLAKAVAKEFALNEFVVADEYLPIVLKNAFFSWGNGSNVQVTYKVRAEKSEMEAKYSNIEYLKLKAENYPTPEYECYSPKASSEVELPKFLKSEYPNAKDFDKVLVDFMEAAEEPKMEGENKFAMDFELTEVANNKPVKFADWFFNASNDQVVWIGKERNGNKYMQISANRKQGACDTWAVTPAQTIAKGITLLFDIKYGFYNADCLQVMVSEKFDGAKFDAKDWTNLPLNEFDGYKEVEQKPDGYANDFKTISYDMKKYEGKKLYIAFRYVGEGPSAKTTTCQIDNVKLSTLKLQKKDARFNKLYMFKGADWKEVKAKGVYTVSVEDYKEMGGNVARYSNFSNVDEPKTYLPVLLANLYPYAQEGDKMLMVYRVNKVGAVAAQYNKTATAWEDNPDFEVNQKKNYIKNDGVWKFDPTITVVSEKSDMKMLVDWVVANNKKGYYSDKYDDVDREYWFGANSKYGNFDFSINKRRENDPDDIIDDKDDEKAVQDMIKQLADASCLILANRYPDAPAELNGLPLHYKVVNRVFDSGANFDYSLIIKSLGNGKFEWTGKVEIKKQ